MLKALLYCITDARVGLQQNQPEQGGAHARRRQKAKHVLPPVYPSPVHDFARLAVMQETGVGHDAEMRVDTFDVENGRHEQRSRVREHKRPVGDAR